MERNKRILIIDDQKEILESIKKLLTGDDNLKKLNDEMSDLIQGFFEEKKEEKLTEESYEVETADRGEVGFELVKESLENKKPFAVAFIDMRMPGWDGLKTAKEIRGIDNDIEIVIITAYTDRNRDDILKAVRKPEKLLYLKKPFDREEIMQIALSLTLKWSLERELSEQVDSTLRLNKGLEEIVLGVDRIEKIRPPKIKDVANGIVKEFSSLLNLKSVAITYRDLNGDYKFIGEEEFRISDDFIFDFRREFLENKSLVYLDEKIFLPLIDSDKLIAIIIIGNRDIKFDDMEKRLIDIFVKQVKNILRNANLYSQISDQNSNLKEADKLNKKLIVLSSHELRTPITLISGYAQMLAQNIYRNEEEKQKMYVGLNSASDRLVKIINMMLELFAMNGNKAKDIAIQKKYIGVDEIYETLEDRVGIFLRKREQKFEIENRAGAQELFVDEVKVIDFILFNLVMNSIKYSKDGETIKLIIENRDDELFIEVVDNGSGVSEENIENILKPFFVIGDDKHHHSGIYEYNSSGLGLGLAVVKETIGLLEEKMIVESELGKGMMIGFTVSEWR